MQPLRQIGPRLPTESERPAKGNAHKAFASRVVGRDSGFVTWISRVVSARVSARVRSNLHTPLPLPPVSWSPVFWSLLCRRLNWSPPVLCPGRCAGVSPGHSPAAGPPSLVTRVSHLVSFSSRARSRFRPYRWRGVACREGLLLDSAWEALPLVFIWHWIPTLCK